MRLNCANYAIFVDSSGQVLVGVETWTCSWCEVCPANLAASGARPNKKCLARGIQLVKQVNSRLWCFARVVPSIVTLVAIFASSAFAQRTYTVKRAGTPPVIDGVDTPGEWEGVEAEGDFVLLRESEGTPDAHGVQFKALWDDDNLYVQVTSNYDGWVLGNEFEDEDCTFGGLNCNMDFNADNLNFYFDPNTDDEPNEDDASIIDGYQIAFNVYEGESSYQQGIANNTGVFLEGHINAKNGNQSGYSYDTGADQWSFESRADDSGAVAEVVFPWTTFGAEEGVDPGFEDGLLHPFAPSAGDEWLVDIGNITSESSNFLPIWVWNSTQSFVSRPDGVWAFSSEAVSGDPQLQAGDADQDLDFDQFDLIKVQVAAKYLTGQAATWGEGDWDAAPGGKVGAPPTGDGQFSQLDIIAALNNGFYLTGPYAALSPGGGGEGDEQTSIIYDPNTGELGVNAPASTELTSINIDSASGIFTGEPAQNLGGSFDNDADNNIFKATFGSAFGSLSFGTVAQAGLSEDFVRNDLTAVGSLAGGGDLGDVDLIYVPEPSAIALMCLGLVGLMGRSLRRRKT